jgi:hypothetical protein
MAKELPYFKFEPGQWDSGNIQLCSLEARGAFINICSLYWQRLGDLPYKLALQKACNGNAVALQSLCDEGVVKLIDDLICIDFLNEQLSEFEGVSKTNSENARSGWEKRRKNATALRNESDRNAIRGEEMTGEEKKKDKKRVSDADKSATLDDRCKQFMEKVAAHLDNYPKEMLREFYDYWTEKNDGGRQLRFEMQKVFDIKKRLITWSKNEKKGHGNSKKRESAADLAKAFGERVMQAHENGEL